MTYLVHIKPKARKNLDKIPERDRIKIRAVLDSIAEEPFLYGKKLSGKKEGQYSVRVWPYRIIYTVEKMELLVIVIDVGHRGRVYR